MSTATAKAIIRLRRIAGTEFHVDERPKFAPSASDHAIDGLAAETGGALPAELHEFFRTNAQIVAMEIHNGYWIGGEPTKLAAAIRAGNWTDRIGDRRAIPFATDGGGNAFLITVDDGAIWSWDHETGAVERLFDSLGGFLMRVAADWEAYAAQTPGWKYLV